jgi:chitin disaccharide deacetylase
LSFVGKPRRQLVVNADDFGFTPDVNRGIVEGHRCGILTATTLMANGDAFEDAVRLARETPSLDVGCHLVLVGGRSVATGRALPATVPALLSALTRRELDVYGEMTAQVRRIMQAGILPTHLDTHKHTHIAPPVLDAVARIGREFDIWWVRRPFDFPRSAAGGAVPLLKRATSAGLSVVRRRFHSVLTREGRRTTDHFAGFQITGRFRAAQLVELLERLPEGSTEFMCHPGFCGDELRRAPTRLRESREEELRALMAPEVRTAVERCGIELVNYGGIAS